MIKTGKISDLNSKYKNWILGAFVEETEFNTKNSKNFEFKWSEREAGYFHPPKETMVPNPNCKSLTLCAKGKFEYTFVNKNGEFKDVNTLSTGEYVYWEPDINHQVRVLEDSLILTIRWYE